MWVFLIILCLTVCHSERNDSEVEESQKFENLKIWHLFDIGNLDFDIFSSSLLIKFNLNANILFVVNEALNYPHF